ncbi:MAG: DUF1178 family protein [Rhodospirillaceae bacterium]|nr:DUF1178 family protein [Rhodospirillaceae bacterium]
MIRFSLNCAKGHEFDAWFRNGDTYDRQIKRGEVRCPDCGSAKVKKAIMAPAIGKRSRGEAAPAEAPASVPAPVPAATETPAAAAPEPAEMHIAGKLREALREMRRFIEQNAEHVGPRFADEARKMHRGEAEERSIYGEASDEEAESLRDEGIEFGRMPWPKFRHDS